MNELEPFFRNNDIKIFGVEKPTSTNLFKDLENIGAHVNFNNNVNKVDFIHCVQTRNTEHLKPIIVKFP